MMMRCRSELDMSENWLDVRDASNFTNVMVLTGAASKLDIRRGTIDYQR